MHKNVLILLFLFAVITSSNSFADTSRLANFIKNNLDGSQTLRGHLPSAVATSKFLYHAYSREVLNLQIELPIQNQAQLTGLLKDLYDPKSPRYHQWFTPQQFSQQFGYNGDEINSVKIRKFMQSQGLSVVGQSPNGLVLYVSGPVPAVENALGLHINHYQKNDGTAFFAPDTDPTIPSQMAGLISAIGGLDNLPKFKPHFQKHQLNNLPHALGTGPGGFLAPNDVKTAYNLFGIPVNGSGQTPAVFELDGYKASDITQYEAQFSLPNVTLQNILIDGFNGAPNYASGGAAEVTLDIELMAAFTSGSTILVYESFNTIQSWIDEWTRIASDNKAKVVSCSWGEPEIYSPTLNFDNMIFQQMAVQGQSVFVASGDNGAFDAGGSTLAVDEPASQPYVTAVGISKLTTNSNGSYSSESASIYGGGGISAYWSIPSYQMAAAASALAAAKVSTTMRNLPDVVLTADAATGYAFYINGSWGGYYGSSISAPIWA